VELKATRFEVDRGVEAAARRVVVDHLDAVARGVRDEDAPALGIEGGVIEGASGGAWYGDGSDRFQRHDGLTAARAPSVALTTSEKRDKRKTALASSTRNLLEPRVLRRAWTGGPSDGEPACPRSN